MLVWRPLGISKKATPVREWPFLMRGDGSVSRVLYTAEAASPTIYLGQSSRKGSINLPAGAGRAARCRCGRSRAGVPAYLVFQPLRFTQPGQLPARWCALTAPFHPYRPPKGDVGGTFLWHSLSWFALYSPVLPVRKQGALRCPDFPRRPSCVGRRGGATHHCAQRYSLLSWVSWFRRFA
jgi:hypothetical protein